MRKKKERRTRKKEKDKKYILTGIKFKTVG
jgi:hypothetical protein